LSIYLKNADLAELIVKSALGFLAKNPYENSLFKRKTANFYKLLMLLLAFFFIIRDSEK